MVSMLNEKSNSQDGLLHSHTLLMAFSRVAHSFQKARTFADFYRAIGFEIKSLGGEVTLLLANSDRTLTMAYTSFSIALIESIERITGKSSIGYTFTPPADSIYACKLDGGNTEFIHWNKGHLVDVLPATLHPLAGHIFEVFHISEGFLAPLRVDGETLGLLVVSGLSLSEDDVTIMDLFSAQIAVGLQNLRLLQKLQDELNAREKAEEKVRQTETYFKSLIENAPDGIALLGLDGKLKYVSPSSIATFGFDENDDFRDAPVKFIHPDDLSFVLDVLNGLIQNRTHVTNLEYRYMHKDGSYHWVESRFSFLMDGAGVEGIVINFHDINERKQAQIALTSSEAELRALFASIHDTVLVIDRYGSYQKIAPTNPGKFYIPPQEVVGNHLSNFFSAEWVGKFLDVIQEVLQTGQTMQIEYPIFINEQMPWFEASVSPMGEDCTLWVARDITERKQVEAKLQLQSAALEAAANTIVITDRDGLIQWANSAFTNLTGYEAGEVIGKSPRQLVRSGKQDQPYYQVLWDTILSGHTWHNELINRRKDGSLYYEEMTITPLRNAKGEIDHFIAVKQDITERKLAEDALRASEDKFRSVISQSADGILLSDESGRVIEFNAAIERITGLTQDEVLGKFLWDVQFQIVPQKLRSAEFYERSKEILQNSLLDGESPYFNKIIEAPYERADGTKRFIQQRAFSIRTENGWRIGNITRDVTENKIAEETLHQQIANLNSLYQMTAILGQTSVLEEVYDTALNSLKSTLATDRVSVLLFDADDVMRFKAWRGLSDAYRKAAEGHSPWKRDAQDPQPVLVPDVHADPDLSSLLPIFVQEGIGALGFIPLTHQGALLGKFMIYFNAPHVFSDEEVQLAQTIARHVGLAIARKLSEDELRNANKSLEIAHLELQQALAHEQVLARTDGLTGLYNRRYFHKIAEREFETAIRHKQPLTIVLFDVDGFKQFNDTFGHALGDSVLIQVAQTAALHEREVDALARYGGDEFIILLPHTDDGQAYIMAERIRERVAALCLEANNSSLFITISIGIAEISLAPQDQSVESTIHRADLALYEAKQNGRNHTVIYKK